MSDQLGGRGGVGGRGIHLDESLTEETVSIIRSQFPHIHLPNPHERVYNDECVLSFDSPYSEGGLYVNLVTLLGYGERYLEHDISKSGSKLYLYSKWLQIPKKVEESKSAPTKLAIGTEGGFNLADKFETVKEHHLVVITSTGIQRYALTNPGIPEYVVNICNAIIENSGMRSKMQADTWSGNDEISESKYARSLIQLNNGKKISNDPKTWKCEVSGQTENLWLNLSTGYIGGGRKNWDGTGGSGAALQHYIDNNRIYPLCVKLGTITPHGADVWSYADDEDCLVKDPLLAEHLAHWGIDIMTLEKTDKTLTEIEVEKNMNYDWSKLIEDGTILETVTGPGLLGLVNIGSSCYMNSVLQLLISLPEIQNVYFRCADDIIRTCPLDDPTSDFFCQFSKVAIGLLSPIYVPYDLNGVEGKDLQMFKLAPRMFKHLVSKNHKDFSSGQQQDASEYFQYLLNYISRSERFLEARVFSTPPNQLNTSKLFEFEYVYKYQCLVTGEVKFDQGAKNLHNVLELRIPTDKAVNLSEFNDYQEKKRVKQEGKESANEPEPLLEVNFEDCLKTTFDDETVDFVNPAIGRTNAMKSTKFNNFPKYLVIKLGRYFVDSNWRQKKIDAKVLMPELLNLGHLRSQGLQPGEVLMKVDQYDTPAQQQKKSIVNLDLLPQITGMGFSEFGARRAIIATGGNDIEAAMQWVFEHMEDADFNEPIAEDASESKQQELSVDADSIAMLSSLGYTEQQATAALLSTDNNIERAADWLFSRADCLDAAVAEVLSGKKDGDSAAATTEVRGDDGKESYSLHGFITHLGRNTDCGHYVCHIKRGDKWYQYNDEVVAVTPSPPLAHGFIYFYQRDD